MTTLSFMGVSEPESFRCRVYDGRVESTEERARVMMAQLYSPEGWTEIDSLAFDRAVEELRRRGWLPQDGELVPLKSGPGKVKVWRLTPAGRAAWEAMRDG